MSPMLNKWRCRVCDGKISRKDTAIEIVTVAVLFAVILSSDWDGRMVGKLVFALTLLPLIWIDWEFLRIPNSILSLGTVGVLTASVLFDPGRVGSSVAAALIALSLMMCVRAGGTLIFKRPALGMGDVKLSGFIALHMGISGFLVALWIGSVGALVYVLLRGSKESVNSLRTAEAGGFATGRDLVPFGSFLSGASLLVTVCVDGLQTLLETWSIWIP